MTELPEPTQFGDYGEWPGRAVLDPSGERLGEVREIYLDDATDRPEWVLVERDGRDPRFVPLADAHVEADTIRVAQSSARIEAAPSLEPSKRLTLDEERELYSHYGVQLDESVSDSILPATDDTADSGHRDTPGAPSGDAAPEETATAPTGGPADESGRDDTASGGLGLSTAAGESAGGAEALTGDRAGDESAAAAGMAMAAGGTAGTGGPASGAQAPAGAGGTTAPSEADASDGPVADAPQLPPAGETSEPADRGPMIPPRPEPVAPPRLTPPESGGRLSFVKKRPVPVGLGIAAAVGAVVFVVLRRRS